MGLQRIRHDWSNWAHTHAHVREGTMLHLKSNSLYANHIVFFSSQPMCMRLPLPGALKSVSVPELANSICEMDYNLCWTRKKQQYLTYKNQQLYMVQLNKISYQYCVALSVGFPGGTRDKELACQCRRHKRHGFSLWVRKIPWKRAWQPTPVFLSGGSHGQRSLVGYSP